MTFTVTYRAKDGALREERVEAADRAGCVAECRRRGIAPTKIAEGGKGKDRDKRGPSREAARGDARPPSQRARRPFPQWLIAALIVVAVGVGVWWWFGGRGATALPAEKPAKHKVEKPAKPKAEKPKDRAEAQPSPVAATNVAQVAAATPAVAAPTGHVIKARVVTNTPRAFFKRDFEHALHVALMPNGMGGTLLRQVRSRYTDEQILAMLKERVAVEPGDDETTAAVKQKVQSFKDEVLRVIGEGASVSEVLDGMTRRKVEDGILRARAHKIRTEALRSGDPDTARKGIEAANAVLRENGLREMDVPQRLKADGEAADGDAPQETVSDEKK